MDKCIFLSFRPEFFRPILYGIKKYEYRKRFCKEATIAYLYLSYPVQEVVGIIELLKPMISDELLNIYATKSNVYSRIKRSIAMGEHYIIPIRSLRLFKTPIPIKEIKGVEANFYVPQCYCNLENHKSILKYLKSRELMNEEFVNDHSRIYEDNLCVLCREMEDGDEYRQKDILFRSNPKYDIIKCQSLKERMKHQ